MKSIGLCGDNCQYCPRYIATQNGSTTELENVKELWIRLGLRTPDFPIEDMACHGCKPENECSYPDLYACVSEKAHKNCGGCDEYPCNIIKKVFHRSERLRSHAANVCTHEEMDLLNKAFFSKKEYFDDVSQDRSKKTIS